MFNFQLCKFASVSDARPSRPTCCFCMKNVCAKIYEIILYVLVFINLLFKTGYACSRKLILSFLFLFVLDSNFQTLLNILFPLSLLCCGDIERNPGPKKSMGIFFCHWNLDSISLVPMIFQKFHC